MLLKLVWPNENQGFMKRSASPLQRFMIQPLDQTRGQNTRIHFLCASETFHVRSSIKLSFWT